MNGVTEIIGYINSFLTAGIIMVLILGGALFYLLKVKKIKAREEHVNHDTFHRRHSMDYVPVERCLYDNSRGMSMIQVNDHVFVAALSIKGFNFFSASNEERSRTIVNSIAFVNLIKQKITLRQSAVSTNIQYNISKNLENGKTLEKEWLLLKEEYESVLEEAGSYLEDPVIYEAYERRLKQLQGQIRAKEWLCNEVKAMDNYMNFLQDIGINSKKTNHIIMSYRYDPNDFIQSLNKEEIRLKAFSQLASQGEAYISALENCGCRASFLNKEELTTLCRKHFHPDTADRISLKTLLNDTYEALYISSDHLYAAEKERIGEVMFETAMEQLETEEEEMRGEYTQAYDAALESLDTELEQIRNQIVEEIEEEYS